LGLNSPITKATLNARLRICPDSADNSRVYFLG